MLNFSERATELASVATGRSRLIETELRIAQAAVGETAGPNYLIGRLRMQD